jgi:TonB-linked SusC/RagA family outer membrane protein
MQLFTRVIVGGLLASALPALAAAQGPGSGIITGSVTNAQQQPIPSAQVYIVSTQNGARTDDQGRYRIVNVAPGTYTVRATRIGYEAAAQTVTVAAGQTATIDFAMKTASVTLDAVVTTATGEQQRKRETGNAVATIPVTEIPRSATPNMASLLNARAPGVTVIQAGGTTGTSQRVRIRGANSVNLNNEPLVIIDGVRVDNGNALTSFSIGVGGQTTSRLNDINFEDIENLEILKGPAASALYGTAAANGVIQITTKRGRAGATRWNTYIEQGTLTDPTDYPYNYGNFNRQYGGAVSCFLADQFVPNPFGGCSADSLAKFSPLKAADPYRTGYHQRYGANAGGGTDAIQYFLSADLEQETGVLRNNSLQQLNLRSNINASLRPDLNTGVTIGYVSSDLQLPQNDNNNLGILGGFLLGSAQTNTQLGYVTRRPDSLYFLRAGQGIERFTVGANPVYNPLSWLRFNATVGYDVLNRDDHNVLPPNRITNNTNNRIGYRTRSKYQIFNYTANASGTATKSLTTDFLSTTTLGAQFQRDNFTSVQGFGRNLLAGTGSLAGTASNFAVAEDNIDTRTLGFLASEQIGFRDRLFLTGTVRGDRNSSFGADFGFVNYPSASLSYVISEEPFFPKTDWVSSLRLRSAYGQSGVQPGARDALVYYNPVAVAVNGTEAAGFTIAGLGRKDLKPEVSAEFEAGFEAGFAGDRASLEATYYNKKSRDALIQRNLPPSAGTILTRFENIGSVQNKGLELGLNGSLLRMENLGWDATLNASWNQNKLVKLGKGVDPILFGLGGDTQKHIAGKPLGSYYQRPVTYDDANHNGVIEYDEYTVGDTAVYLGNPLPKREISFNTTVVLHKWVKLYALLDHKGGFYNYNATEDFRCGTFTNCAALYVPGTPLRKQAAALADLIDGTVAGYIEKADFVKLREVAVTLMAPAEWARRARTRELSLTFSGRNLHTWTRYSGFDPEVLSSTTGNFSQSDFLTQPPVRYFTVRLNANF